MSLDKGLCETEMRPRCPRCSTGQPSFFQLCAGNVPSFCQISQSHSRRLKMLPGLGLHTWLLQQQWPLFLTKGWSSVCLVFTSSSFSQAEELLSSWGLQPDIWASDSFCSQAKLHSANGFQTIVHTGFTWLETSGGCGLEYSCRACCKAPSVRIWSYPALTRVTLSVCI